MLTGAHGDEGIAKIIFGLQPLDRVSVTFVPWPTRLTIATLPPCRRAMLCTIGSPRPQGVATVSVVLTVGSSQGEVPTDENAPSVATKPCELGVD